MSNAGGKSEYNNGHCDGCSDILALQAEIKALASAIAVRNKRIAELKVKVDERDTLESHLKIAVDEREKFKASFDSLQKRFEHLAKNEMELASCCVENERRAKELTDFVRVVADFECEVYESKKKLCGQCVTCLASALLAQREESK